jgi:ABC-2 type transport system ATP-binding protein
MNERYEIEMSHIAKYYNDSMQTIGVHDISLKFIPGEIHCILGPNGAGKTTLLKIAGTLLDPSSGNVYINNIRMKEYDENQLITYKKQIGYLFETPFVYNLLTGYEFLNFLGEIYGVEKKVLKERINYYCEIFAILEWKNRYLSTYSQGMLKKIALASTLINDQSVLIYDEPTNSLDPMMIATLKDILNEERKKNKTIIISTHILDIAEKLSDKISIIEEGKVKLTDSISLLEKIDADQKRTRLEKVYFEITNKQE